MITLVLYLIFFSFYIIYFLFAFLWYLLIFIIKCINIFIGNVGNRKKIEEIKENRNELISHIRYYNKKNPYSNKQHNSYNKDEIRMTGAYKLVNPTDLDYKQTVEKIQKLYKDYGFNVKVVDIRKNKYDTEYEIIFSLQETNQYEIFSVSNKIISEFDIDGVKIRRIKNKENRIFIYVPLEYKK